MKPTTKSPTLAAGLVAVLLLVAGCGGNDDAGPTDDNTTVSDAEAETATADTTTPLAPTTTPTTEPSTTIEPRELVNDEAAVPTGPVDTAPEGVDAEFAYSMYELMAEGHPEAEQLNLSPTEAYDRAVAGCGAIPEPGSVDELLTIAYGDMLIELATAGKCG